MLINIIVANIQYFVIISVLTIQKISDLFALAGRKTHSHNPIGDVSEIEIFLPIKQFLKDTHLKINNKKEAFHFY